MYIQVLKYVLTLSHSFCINDHANKKITCTFQSTCTCKKKIIDCSCLIKQNCFKVPINFFLLKCFLSSVKFYVTRL